MALEDQFDIRVQHAVRDVLSDTIKTFQRAPVGRWSLMPIMVKLWRFVSLPDFDANAPMRNGQTAISIA